MSRAFEELDRRTTPMGELVLRRRLEPTLQLDVFEVILAEEHLMSSIFTTAEAALADLALARVDGTELHVLVGGLGLGYTAHTALQDPRVRTLQVIEALGPVIEWHERGLVPLGAELTGDRRCRLVHGDFFALVHEPGPGLSPPGPWDAVLLDIDHTPRHVLHPSHVAFYEPAGLQRVHDHLTEGGVFALWSDDPPEDAFLADLSSVFARADAHVVEFPNFHTGGTATNTVYLGSRRSLG